jgi:hypothetical protein
MDLFVLLYGMWILCSDFWGVRVRELEVRSRLTLTRVFKTPQNNEQYMFSLGIIEKKLE